MTAKMIAKNPMSDEINQIKPYEKNAKQHEKKQLLQLAKIVAEVGWRQPVLVNQDGVIVVGHGRWYAWKEFGDKMHLPPIWVIDDKGSAIHGGPSDKPLSPEQETTYRLADNKLNESKWEMGLVIDELKTLSEMMIDLTGFTTDLILETKEDDFDLSAVGTPKSNTGDIYELGPHKIICGDSTDAETYKKLLGDERPVLIFTDPPYSVDYLSAAGMTYSSEKYGGTGGKIFNDDKSPAEALEFYKQVLTRLHEFSTDNASIYWWFASRITDINMEAFRATGWHYSQTAIWLKNSLIYSPGQLYHRIYEPCMVGWKESGGAHYRDIIFSNMTELWTLDKKTFADYLDIWYQKRDPTSKYIHPTQKPVQLAERALKRSSQKGDLILDAFLGSGSTLIAADQLDRRCYGVELDQKYVDAVVTRWCQFKDVTHVIKNGIDILW